MSFIKKGDVKSSVGPQDMSPWGTNRWSDDAQLLWRVGEVGQKVEVSFDAPRAGRYQIVVRTTQAPDFGIVQFSVDGQNLGQPVDCYGAKVAPAPAVTLGTVDLTAGPHALGMECLGKNDAGTGIAIGLDYIKLLPVP